MGKNCKLNDYTFDETETFCRLLHQELRPAGELDNLVSLPDEILLCNIDVKYQLSGYDKQSKGLFTDASDQTKRAKFYLLNVFAPFLVIVGDA